MSNPFEIHITRDEILMNRDREYPLTPHLEDNLRKLLLALNKFRNIYGKPMQVTSGYRPGKYNDAAGGAPNSAHISCEACDFADPLGELDDWCQANVRVLEQCGLWLESPTRTPGWTHMDIRPRNNRIFIP